jgi:hypothetical protein
MLQNAAAQAAAITGYFDIRIPTVGEAAVIFPPVPEGRRGSWQRPLTSSLGTVFKRAYRASRIGIALLRGVMLADVVVRWCGLRNTVSAMRRLACFRQFRVINMLKDARKTCRKSQA